MVKIQVNSQGKAYYTSAGKVLLAPESGGAQVESVNNTGSAITSGDKVWINESSNGYELVNYYSNVPNFDIIGSPTIINKVVSGFSENDYLQLPYPFNPGNNSWEIVFKIRTGDELTGIINPIMSSRLNKSSFASDRFGLVFQIENGKFKLNVSSNGTSWTHSVEGTYNILYYTVYWVKVTYNGTYYKLYYSLNGVDYIEDINFIDDPIISSLKNTTVGAYSDGTYNHYFKGSMDLSESYIKINGTYWWTPYVTNVIFDTQTGIAAENIAAGNTGLVNVGAVIEPTGSITITTNGTHDVADYAEAIVNVTSSDKYKVGDRVNDDSNNPVGTVSSIFTDGNGDRYAVVCLDAVNRLAKGNYLNNATVVSGIPQYSNQTVWSASETATTNTDAILATGTSSACSHCRTNSFIIEGKTYYGQLPCISELTQIFMQRIVINNQDPTASTYSSLIIPTTEAAWSSTQNNNSNGWFLDVSGFVGFGGKQYGIFIIPVLEIPLDNSSSSNSESSGPTTPYIEPGNTR